MDAIIPGTQTLHHGLAILKAVAKGARTLAQLVEVTQLSRSKAHRLAQALRIEGFLTLDSDGQYTLGSALIQLGFQARDEISIVHIARPILAHLSAVTGDTVHLGVLDGGGVLYLHKERGRRNVEIRSVVGERRLLSRTGLGKALLLDSSDGWEEQYKKDTASIGQELDQTSLSAYLKSMQKAANNGVAYDLEENEENIRCVAAPIRDASQNIVAALSISSIKTHMNQDRMTKLSKLVTQSASKISTSLGYNVLR